MSSSKYQIQFKLQNGKLDNFLFLVIVNQPLTVTPDPSAIIHLSPRSYTTESFECSRSRTEPYSDTTLNKSAMHCPFRRDL